MPHLVVVYFSCLIYLLLLLFLCFDTNNILIFHSLFICNFHHSDTDTVTLFILFVIVVVVVFVSFVTVVVLPFICCKCQSPLWRLNILHVATTKNADYVENRCTQGLK